MKTLENINPQHLQEFKEFLAQVLQSEWDAEPIDLLPWARKIFDYKVESSYPYMDHLINHDIQPEIFSGKAYPNIQVICYNFTDGNRIALQDVEPDFVIFSITFKTPYNKGLDPTNEDDIKQLFTLIMSIMLSDCTGCCDALDFINLTKYGVISQGNVGNTYHS